MRTIDLNADLGEDAGFDDELLQLVTSASVACGAHAGSEQTIRAVVRRAKEIGVSVGAHPGYPDREGFGRREPGATPADIERWVRLQLETFVEICGDEGVSVRYVKAHGALYNRAVHDAAAAAAFVGAVAAAHRELAVLALPASQMLVAARAAGMRPVREAFLDRGYLADGSLAPRDFAGAMITDAGAAAKRALQLAHGEPILDVDGRALTIAADSLCVHGDSPDALAMLRAVRERLAAAGIGVKAFTQ